MSCALHLFTWGRCSKIGADFPLPDQAFMTKFAMLVFLLWIAVVGAANAASGPDTYSCPKLVGKNGGPAAASGIALYSGHPSERAVLKPENADTDDTGPAFWAMGPSEYDYWYVCSYDGMASTREFKLPRKVYSRCSNIGSGNVRDQLKCQ